MFSIVTCDLSVQLSCSVVLDTLWPHGCKTSGFPVHHQLPEFTHTHPLSWWCHPPISSSVVPFFSCLQSFPASGSFPVSQFFTSGGQSIGVSASVLPMNITWLFRTDFLEGWLVGSPCNPRDSQESSPTTQFKSINFSALSFLYSSHPYTTTGKTIALTRWTFVG